jgi:hypothetical protein
MKSLILSLLFLSAIENLESAAPSNPLNLRQAIDEEDKNICTDRTGRETVISISRKSDGQSRNVKVKKLGGRWRKRFHNLSCFVRGYDWNWVLYDGIFGWESNKKEKGERS